VSNLGSRLFEVKSTVQVAHVAVISPPGTGVGGSGTAQIYRPTCRCCCMATSCNSNACCIGFQGPTHRLRPASCASHYGVAQRSVSPASSKAAINTVPVRLQAAQRAKRRPLPRLWRNAQFILATPIPARSRARFRHSRASVEPFDRTRQGAAYPSTGVAARRRTTDCPELDSAGESPEPLCARS